MDNKKYCNSILLYKGYRSSTNPSWIFSVDKCCEAPCHKFPLICHTFPPRGMDTETSQWRIDRRHFDWPEEVLHKIVLEFSYHKAILLLIQGYFTSFEYLDMNYFAGSGSTTIVGPGSGFRPRSEHFFEWKIVNKRFCLCVYRLFSLSYRASSELVINAIVSLDCNITFLNKDLNEIFKFL